MAIVSITGDLASGKSIVAKQLAEALSWQYFSTGSVQRKIAKDLGMTTLELNKYSENHPEIDNQIDDEIRQLATAPNNLVIDSRMAWHFLPSSFKVFLSVDITTAAQRVMADNVRTNEPVYSSLDDAISKLMERKESENKRYMQLYDVDCSNMSNFDLELDTSYANPTEVAQKLLNHFRQWESSGVTS